MSTMLGLILLGFLQGVALVSGNIALRQPVTQSSNYKTFSGAKAVDGDTNGMWRGGSCFATTYDDKTPWWMVDVGSDVKISTVTIYNRADCCGQRLRNLKIVVYRENPELVPEATGVLCGQVINPVAQGKSVSVQCDAAAEGRYVRIVKKKRNRKDLLSFCEVEITGALDSPEEGPLGGMNEQQCPSGYNAIGNECLRFVPTYATFVEAMTYCENMNSDLLMIKSEQLDSAVGQYIQGHDLKGNNYYVGATDMEEMGVFRWVDGSTVNAHWRRGNNSNRSETKPLKTGVACGYVNGTTAAWEAMPCAQSLFFICQRHM